MLRYLFEKTFQLVVELCLIWIPSFALMNVDIDDEIVSDVPPQPAECYPRTYWSRLHILTPSGLDVEPLLTMNLILGGGLNKLFYFHYFPSSYELLLGIKCHNYSSVQGPF